MKKLISLFLILALTLALCVPALAGGEGGLLIAPNPNTGGDGASEAPGEDAADETAPPEEPAADDGGESDLLIRPAPAEIDADGIARSSPYYDCLGNRACPMWYFPDLPGNTWFHDGVHFCLDAGLMTGVISFEDGVFAADSPVLRAEFMQAIYQFAVAAGADVSAGENTNILSYDDAFDIPEGYFEAFQWACAVSLIGGETPSLNPLGTLTREELIVLLYEFAQRLGIDVSVWQNTNILSYDDAFEISEGCFEAFQWACGAGIIQGTADTTLNPAGIASRAQLATILARLNSCPMLPADGTAEV